MRRVVKLITSLSEIKATLNESDLEFLANLETKFQDYLRVNEEDAEVINETQLEQSDLKWILELFATRWQKIADTYDDYTFYSGGVNAPWVTFAKELSEDLKKNYLLILIPVLSNPADPNNLSLLRMAPDARSIYLSNDNTWHRMKALYEELKKPTGVFGILNNSKDVHQPKESVQPRALTLNELNRIRSKRGEDLVWTANDLQSYTCFWDYVIKKCAPTWRDYEACSSYMLPNLLGLIENYFEMVTQKGDLKAFRTAFKFFISFLSECPLLDVNHLYGAQIKVNDKNYFLVDILLDCMQTNQEGLEEKLYSVVRWICKSDPSLISKSDYLKPIYRDLYVGDYFTLEGLYELTRALKIEPLNLIIPLHNELLIYLKTVIQAGIGGDRDVHEELISKIKILYATRWELIIDSPLDYFRYQQHESNYGWIRLAQFLAGAGYIESNYYKLMIPSLRHDVDPVTESPLTHYPLSKYILSTNGHVLIYLKNCEDNYKINGTFYKWDSSIPEPLSNKEKQRLAFADPNIYDLFLRILNKEKSDDPPLPKDIIDELRKLVNNSFYPRGLVGDLTSDEYKKATRGYDAFTAYINQISEEKKNNLLKQKISYRGTKRSVQEILDSAQTPIYNERYCITWNTKYLAKLVIDYAPLSTFRNDIEETVNVAKMRRISAKKLYSDYNFLKQEESIKRIMILFTSIMTHSFQYAMITGVTVRFSDYCNNVNETGNKIYEFIKDAIFRGDWKYARFLYAQLIEHIVKPAILSYKSTWMNYHETQQWLDSIINETMFQDDQRIYFDPEILLTGLWPLAKTNRKLKPHIEKFLDKLHEILLSPDNRYKQWIMVNIEFSELLQHKHVSPNISGILYRLQHSPDLITDPGLAIRTSKEFLLHRLAQIISLESSKKQNGIYGASPGNYATKCEEYKAKLVKNFAASVQDEDKLSLKELVLNLEKATMFIEKGKFETLTSYLHKLSPSSHNTSSPCAIFNK